MNILQISHRLPWPLHDGGKIESFSTAQRYINIVADGKFGLVCMAPNDEKEILEHLATHNIDIAVDFFDTRNRYSSIFKNFVFSNTPYNMAKYQRKSFSEIIIAHIKKIQPEVVHFDGLQTAIYVDLVNIYSPKSLKIFRCHNAEHIILKRYAENQKSKVVKKLIAIQAKRLLKYESEMINRFDLVIPITDVDAEILKRINPKIKPKVFSIPAAVSVEKELPKFREINGKLNMLHVASMAWPPNHQGLRWLLYEVLPILDHFNFSYHLDVIGKNMSAEFLDFKHSNVSIHGYVENLDEFYRKSHLGLVPLQAGSGMRLKILEYWSKGTPVLSTSIGAEGLADRNSKLVTIADTKTEFAEQIMYLANNSRRLKDLRRCAHAEVTLKYEKSVVESKFAALLCELNRR